MTGYTYILKCSDGSYYVGSTKNLELRIAQHQAGEGANHTKKRLPIELVYYEEYSRIDDAFYREKQIQGWRREKKEALIKGEFEMLPELAKSYGKTLPSIAVVEPVETTKTPNIINTLGNEDLLKLPKTAFLCSRKVPASVVLKCYDWAITQREEGNCVISGFHSQIEKDVLHYLLKGKQPIILALARGLKEKLEPELLTPLKQERLLIISPFEKTVKRVTETTAITRNELMIALANNIALGYVSQGGQLEKLLKETQKLISKVV